MTPDEFEFWQRAYLAALTGAASQDVGTVWTDNDYSVDAANEALESYRTAKATVADND